jgi:hypothetical protein
MCQRTTRPDKSMRIHRWLAFAARLGHWTRIALQAPALAVVPILCIALGAYLAGSDAFFPLVEGAFATFAIACPAVFLVGLPTHLVIVRLVDRPGVRALLHMAGGILAAGLLSWLRPDSSDWTGPVWLAVGWQGGLTGLLLWRLSNR